MAVRIGLCICLLLATRVWARPVGGIPLQEMLKEADLVAVIRPLATTNANASDRLFSAGERYGPRNPDDYQSMNTRFQVLNILHTSYGLRQWNSNELVILHFRYAPNIPEFNGGCFMYFDYPPTEIWSMVRGKWQWPIGTESTPVYLAYLKRHKDGRFIPVTGQYDSEFSFRVLSTPSGGAIRYCYRDGIEVPKIQGTNMPTPNMGENHKLDAAHNLGVWLNPTEHRVRIYILSTTDGLTETTRSLDIANTALPSSCVQAVKLDPASSETQYFIRLTKQDVNYQAIVGIIAYRLKEWEFLVVPDDLIEIVETNGHHEIKCNRLQKKTYTLQQGVLREK